MASLRAHSPNASQGAKNTQRVSRTGFYPFNLLSKQLYMKVPSFSFETKKKKLEQETSIDT